MSDLFGSFGTGRFGSGIFGEGGIVALPIPDPQGVRSRLDPAAITWDFPDEVRSHLSSDGT